VRTVALYVAGSLGKIGRLFDWGLVRDSLEESMRRYLVVGNWKMHGCKAGVSKLLAGITTELVSGFDGTDKRLPSVVVCPAYIFIPQVADALSGSAVSWGAQNLSDQSEGAYTGEVSAAMLVEHGCQYVIVGHSERRNLYAETDQLVAAKFSAAQAAGMVPIHCVGESLQQRESGDTLACIEQQLQTVIDSVGIDSYAKAVVAYEPVWAIGTGKTATPAQAQEVHAHIRQVLAAQSPSVAALVQILYGGSVKAENAAQLFAQDDIDGALVGGASLNIDEFAAICRAAN
jgi:triosephosphate isomerase